MLQVLEQIAARPLLPVGKRRQDTVFREEARDIGDGSADALRNEQTTCVPPRWLYIRDFVNV